MKIAVCISGQMRTFDQTIDNLKKYLLEKYDCDINPHVLFDMADKVFCVTSGMGFEALLRGIEVHTFGMPFYAGWGVTKDVISLDRRSKVRTIEEIFQCSYVICSRYYNPQTASGGEIEDVIEYLCS